MKYSLFGAFFIGDLKIINILAGVMSNSATFPCAFCTIDKKDLGMKFGSLRTTTSIAENYTSWKASGGHKNNAKSFNNCVNLPLFEKSDETFVLDVCSPPSLHLLLGMVNTVYNSIAECNLEMAQSWTAAASATRHAQFGFTGRHCRSLLKKRSILESDSSTAKYAEVLNELQRMVDACFGSELREDFQQSIEEFCKAWRFIQLPMTPKFHIIHQHVKEFCSNKNTGLAKYSEQTTEAIHRDFTKKWENYKVPHTSSDFAKNLLNCVVSYNSLHIV